MSSPVYLRHHIPIPENLKRVETPSPRDLAAAAARAKRNDWRATFLIGAATFLFFIPAAMLLWPKAPLIAAADRGVVISGPVLAFEQSTSQIKLRLPRADTARQVVVTSAGPDAAEVTTRVDGSAGWVSVKLPPSLVAAHSLDVKVQ